MNAAIVGVCEAAERSGAGVVAFKWGFRGLSEGEGAAITAAEARAHMNVAGTWLGSSRHTEMRTDDGVGRVRLALNASGAAGLVVIGGDGSLHGARALAGTGVPVAFIPATIDNDVSGTDTTVGIDSAVNYALTVIAQLRITGRSLGSRAFLVQTLGGETQELARAVAAAANVAGLLLTGDAEELERVAATLRVRVADGDAIAVMPEGIGNAVDVAAALERRAGLRVHPTILGHAQRAAAPTAVDLTLALDAGRAAAAALLAGRSAFIALSSRGPHRSDLVTG
jgi:6-phosphofructokinase 1